MPSTITIAANLGATGLAGTAGFVVYNADWTVFQSRAASVSTVAQIASTTTYKGSFSGDPAATYYHIWDNGGSPPAYSGAGTVNPGVNVATVANVMAIEGDGTAAAVAAGTITLDASDPQNAANLAGWQVRILSAGGGTAGQVATIQSSNTSTHVQTLTANWAATPSGTVVYQLVPPVNASLALGTDSISAAAMSAGAVTKIQAGLATPTNITAGVITTVSGNIAGTVGGLATQAKTDVENAVWNGLHGGHTTTGTFGNFLDGAISGVTTGGVSASAIATAVWQDLLGGSDFTTVGSAGKLLKDNITGPLATASQIPAAFNAALFASPGVFATAALANAPGTTGPVTLADGSITSAKFAAGATIPRVTLADTATNLTNAPANGDFTAAQKTSLNAATPTVFLAGSGLNNVMIEANYNLKQAMKVILAACGNIIVGNGTTTVTVGNTALPTPTTGANTVVTATMTGVALVNGVPTAVDRTAIPSVVLSNA